MPGMEDDNSEDNEVETSFVDLRYSNSLWMDAIQSGRPDQILNVVSYGSWILSCDR